VIGRFTTIDPVAAHFPWMTSYQYGSNNPSSKIDLDGLEGIFPPSFLFEESSLVPKGGIPEGYSPENIAKAGGDVVKGSDNASRYANYARGNKSEASRLAENNLQKNTKPIETVDPKTGQKGTTVPDALENEGKSTFETKNVKQQGLTKQLRLQEKFSNDNGFQPKLDINQSAELSQPLKNSSFDIQTYGVTPITLKADLTKIVPVNLAPTVKPLTPVNQILKDQASRIL